MVGMTVLRRFPVVLVVAVIAVGVVSRVSSASSSAAAPTAFSSTIAGTDMHALDPHLQPMFVPGGGVLAVDTTGGATVVKYKYLETGLNLPVGARVISVAVTYSLCGSGPAPSRFVFGSYSPTSRTTLQNATLLGSATSCAPKTITKTGSPITTTVAGRRYAFDFAPVFGHTYPADFAYEVFYGATIKYTCTSPCVP